MHVSDTIVALSTPVGRGGIGVIRLSGEQSLPLIRQLVRDDNLHPESNRVILRSLFNPENGDLLDQALVTLFKSPNSYTGEDVIEISCHGSPALISIIIDTLLRLGARTASPGEFTQRAYLNGRLNLSQAEAVRDLIDARTYISVKQAVRQLKGELSAYLHPLKNLLLDIIVILESSLEFVEDDLPSDFSQGVLDKLTVLGNKLEAFADSYKVGRLIRDGLKVPLIGRPNVGKSSLFNALLAYDRAIVTPIPGTTRDTMSESIDLYGLSVLLTDTAGLRSSSDTVEQFGIERTHRTIADADLVVLVIDGSVDITKEDLDIFNLVKESFHLIVANKCDLNTFDLETYTNAFNTKHIMPVSAVTYQNLDTFRNAIIEQFNSTHSSQSDLIITSARHYDLLIRAVKSINTSKELLLDNVSEEIVVSELHNALNYLGDITGETTSEDILTRIFSTFCIGK